MCFMYIPVDMAGYRVQKFIASIIILLMPLAEERYASYWSRKEDPRGNNSAPVRTLREKKSPGSSCITGQLRKLPLLPSLHLGHPLLQHPSNLGCIFVLPFSSKFLRNSFHLILPSYRSWEQGNRNKITLWVEGGKQRSAGKWELKATSISHQLSDCSGSNLGSMLSNCFSLGQLPR